MKILAIDTALAAASACVLDDRSEAPEALETLPMERGHAEALLPLVDRIMARVEGGFSALGRVAVTVGPGSFTGLRVGVSAARAIGLACEIPVVGVSTLAAFAAPLILEQRHGLVGVAIDARHGNVYFTAFGPDGRPILPPRVATVREAARSLGAGPVRLVGSGAALLAAEAEAAGTEVEVIEGIVVPDIAFVARLGLLADPAFAPPRPLYLKAPDAKLPQDAKLRQDARMPQDPRAADLEPPPQEDLEPPQEDLEPPPQADLEPRPQEDLEPPQAGLEPSPQEGLARQETPLAQDRIQDPAQKDLAQKDLALEDPAQEDSAPGRDAGGPPAVAP